MALITGFGSKLSRLYHRWAHLQICTLITAVKRRNPSRQEGCSDVSWHNQSKESRTSNVRIELNLS